MDKVIYDNSCQFCITIKSVLEKLDFFNQFHWIGSNDALLELNQLVKKEIITAHCNSFAVLKESTAYSFSLWIG